MKNDAFSDNFPNKFFFTESLRSGYLPLWNPYLNFGFPVYADPGFAFWNPTTWFFGALIGYNAYTLTLEVLSYIYLAGITMYHLGRYLKFTPTISVTIAAMYMCSGFFTGELQHINFLTGAAFLPFLLQRFLALFQNPDKKNAFLLAVAYYMIFASGHPALPIASIYFLFTLFLSFLFLNPTFKQNWKRLLLYHAISIGVFVVLYSPALYSYLSILPEYGRGAAAEQSTKGAMQTGFSLSSYLSFLYPFATTKNSSFFTDDLAMRNAYFSVAGFALMLTQLRNKSFIVRSLLVCCVLMLLLSIGGFLKTILYSNLPFLSYIRTNGEFRIFTITCLCVVAGFALNGMKGESKNKLALLRTALKCFLVVSITLLCFVLVTNFTHFTNYSENTIKGLKGVIDSLTFTDVLLVSLLINVTIVIALLVAKANIMKLSFIIALDLVLNSILYLPFSGVGVVMVSEIQQQYNISPKGIVIPPLINIKDVDTLPTKTTGLIGSWAFYNKKIGITRLQDYPSYFVNTEAYFNSSLPNTINDFAYVFLKSNIESSGANHNSGKNLIVTSFSPEKITINVHSKQNDSLVLLQNHYRFWKAKVNNNEVNVNRSLITFMSVPLGQGSHTVTFLYEDNGLYVFMAISLVSFIVVLVSIYVLHKRERNRLEYDQ
jgi:hypothetical protein